MTNWNELTKNQKIDFITSGHKSGKTLSEIAGLVGTTIASLKMFCSRNKISLKREGSGHPTNFERKAKRNQSDIAKRLMQLQGLVAFDDIKKEFFFSDDELKSFIGNPELFSSKVISVSLQPYQVEMINNFIKYKRNCVSAGRATGKSFTASVFLVYNSIITPNQKSLVVCPAERQSRLLFEQIQKFIASSDSLFNSIDARKTNNDQITFTNGSIIIPLPSTTYIRGFQNVNYIVCDEAGYFNDPEAVFSSIEPMLSIRNERTGEYGSLILLSTPNGTTGKFFEYFNSPQFKTMQLPSSVNKYVSKEWLEEQKTLMSAMTYDQEILANFREEASNFFGLETIKQCTKDYQVRRTPTGYDHVVCGIDTGRYKDATCIYIAEVKKDGIKRIVSIEELNNIPIHKQREIIKFLHQKWNFKRICIEKAGLSTQLVEELKALRLPIMEFIPTIDHKMEAYNYLLKEMEDNRIVIPNHQKLQFQLRMFRYEVSNTGKLKLHHKTEEIGDDHVDAFCFCIWASKGSGLRGYISV